MHENGHGNNYLEMQLYFHNQALDPWHLPIFDRLEHGMTRGFAVPVCGYYGVLGREGCENDDGMKCEANLKPIFSFMLTSR